MGEEIMNRRTLKGTQGFLALVSLAIIAATVACGGGSDDVAGPENTVAILLAGTGSGRVVTEPASLDCPGTCGPVDWSPGMTVHMFATPADGSSFASWSGACTGSDPLNCAFVVNGHMTVTATFTSP